ncbi:DUF1345 domain-containing protein [Geodermatophilus ruber]|uniref:Uncharacterized membrane protein n=1 Tax=Geodermatophilus ruber TaxID=504800 RepID=A0A1I4C9W0_9ACTN|nr:DUF1345 domain-containing protein [Geodermatophilus ruber]SFK77964.1 Uncharacterized membrane protein [Geodermatophilus ruber]
MSAAPSPLADWRTSPAGVHLVVSLTAGAIAGALAGPSLGGETAGLLAWVVAAAVFLLWTWASIWSLDARDTAWCAAREDPSRPIRDVAMLSISIGALVTVVVVIFRVHENPPERTALAVAAIAASWLVMNTIFTLRYTRLYYSQPRGGVDFNQDDDPTFRDFAYVAFTIGMTFQVSDTTLSKTEMRATVLRQGLMSFVYNTVIFAVTVNIIAGLSR